MKENSKILELLNNLSTKDKNICLLYLEKRDFNSIEEIVDSVIYKLEQKTEHTLQEVDTLNELYLLLELLGPYLIVESEYVTHRKRRELFVELNEDNYNYEEC